MLKLFVHDKLKSFLSKKGFFNNCSPYFEETINIREVFEYLAELNRQIKRMKNIDSFKNLERYKLGCLCTSDGTGSKIFDLGRVSHLWFNWV